MEDSQVEGKSSCQIAKPQNEQLSVLDSAKSQSMVTEVPKKVPQNIAIQPKTTVQPHPNAVQKAIDQKADRGTDNTNASSSAVTPGSGSTKPLKVIHKAPAQPVIMPKHINTPDGTILLNANTPIGKTPKTIKPKKVIEIACKNDTLNNKDLPKQNSMADTNHNSIKSKIMPQVATITTPIGNSKLQPSTPAAQMSRSNSVQPVMKVVSPYQTMQRTSSVPIAKNAAAATPVARPSTPTQPHPNTNIYFHPIAIKPKPIQPVPSKGRSKSSSFSRLNTASSIHTSKDQMKPSDSSITLTTSRNWILPPRPKTKKASKKKDKRPIQRVPTTGNTESKSIRATSQKPSSSAMSPKTTSSKKTVATSYPSKLTSSTGIHIVKAEKESSSMNYLGKESTAATRNIVSTASKRSTKTESKRKECTGCTTCVAPGIRSVYLEPSTGKVSINAQIHSNINLYTNDEGELEVQLQHVTRENDNLKKILLKLNKEIQNLKLVKKKEENTLMNSSGTGITSSKAANKIASTDTNIKVEPLENNCLAAHSKDGVPKLSKDNAATLTEPPTEVKQEIMDATMDIDEDSGIVEDKRLQMQVNDDKFLPDMLTANTIDPMNLSYHLESKRQKISNPVPEMKQESSIQPILVQQLSDMNSGNSATLNPKAKQRADKGSTSADFKPKAKAKTPAKSKAASHTTQRVSSGSPCSLSPNNTFSTSSTSNTSAKSIAQVKDLKPPTVKKEYHSCGVCEIGQKCVCFETQTLSIAATIAQALSRGGVNLLGLGGMNNTSINTLNNMSNINGLSTLTNILKREEIMKKLKDDDKKTLTSILKSESTKKGTTKKEKANLNTILGGLNGLPMDENICGMSTINDVSMTGMRNDLAKTSSVTAATAGKDDDDELLQMIDAELLLDPTPLVNPLLLKKDRSTGSTNSFVLKTTAAAETSAADPASSGMRRSESKTSQHSLGTSAEFFGRGSLVDFNAFNGGDAMIDDDAMMFDTTSLGMGNATADLSTDIDKILMEPIDDPDEFMIY
ncbi:hypothetical protein PMKS-001964 [Pichia membranifaciens]|uniref:Hap4 transcription factor heteromerisation domain-containing protein n=1 Tax=Pichia membranifaciens TaxID=4926 RepID=A0A1Q2YGH9_9ASCO|nr:hypothetical protein PMKS-001964 [Pichia membranifaciens]